MDGRMDTHILETRRPNKIQTDGQTEKLEDGKTEQTDK
jgi:hypothetical protein